MDFVLAVVISFVVDLFKTVLVFIIFSAMGVPFLDALSFWQVFGAVLALDIAVTKVSE